MSKRFPKVSFCCGVYNEESTLIRNIQKIKSGLEKTVGSNNYELIIVENGSIDKTAQLLKTINDKNIRVFFAPRKGLGLAFRIAVEKARYEYVILSAIDLPFGFGDLIQAERYWNNMDIIYGSKAHPESSIDRIWKREVASLVYRSLLRLFFGVKIRDTQGTVFFKNQSIKQVLKCCDSDNAFFTAQIAIYGELFGMKMKEVPVQLKKQLRKSKFKLFRDGVDMLRNIIKEQSRYAYIKQTQSLLATSSVTNN